MDNKTAIIIGAGPAGLTAAYQLLKKTDIKPIIFEETSDIGGISKTVNYKGNRIDIGGHRFFSKSDKVMNWWLHVFSDKNEMLVRNRLSRIFYLRKFFNYPISLNIETIKNLGILRTFKIGSSYLYTKIKPIKNENNLEDFLINRFGRELYKTFFRDYTEKVWGINCQKIPAEWGAQRIKGLSISKAIAHAIKKQFKKDSSIGQKQTETSLIDRFLYPKLGPGELWEEVAKKIQSLGGELYLNHKVISLKKEDNKISSIIVQDRISNITKQVSSNYFFSTMPIKDLIKGITNEVPEKNIQDIAAGLPYRDFITVGILLKKLEVQDKTKPNNLIADNWIYIQESDVMMGRIQVFNNWSPYLVKEKNNTWLGLEYFCNEEDDLWKKSDKEMSDLAINELTKIGFITKDNVLDSTVIHMPKTYPAYFGTYNQISEIQKYIDAIPNLYLIGRNGMHRYNNQDHSMLTAMAAVDHICNEFPSKNQLWKINTEQEYHEEK